MNLVENFNSDNIDNNFVYLNKTIKISTFVILLYLFFYLFYKNVLDTNNILFIVFISTLLFVILDYIYPLCSITQINNN